MTVVGGGAEQDSGTRVWATPEWRERAVAWLDAQLANAGVHRVGDVEQPHLRPWATALSAQTNRGKVWLKAACAGTRFEVGLYELLQRAAPRWVLAPIAVDTARGWIVLPDGGPSLGEAVGGAEVASALARILPQYGELQRTLAPHAAALLALGVADMRAPAMPERFDQALEAVRPHVESSETPEDAETFRRVEAHRSTYLEWCNELAAAPVAPSLDHNDLHPWNIFVEPGLAAAKFYACRVGKVARVLTWQRAVEQRTPGEGEHLARAPMAWLASVLDAEYLGPRG